MTPQLSYKGPAPANPVLPAWLLGLQEPEGLTLALNAEASKHVLLYSLVSGSHCGIIRITTRALTHRIGVQGTVLVLKVYMGPQT